MRQLAAAALATSLAVGACQSDPGDAGDDPLIQKYALGWGPVAAQARPAPGAESLAVNALDWVAGCGLVYGSLFGIGKLVLGNPSQGFAYLAGAALCAGVIAFNLTRTRGAAALATRPAET